MRPPLPLECRPMADTFTHAEYCDMVRGPGKFEGEQPYVPYFYDAACEGFSHSSGTGWDWFEVTGEDRQAFPELAEVTSVLLLYSDGGFVIGQENEPDPEADGKEDPEPEPMPDGADPFLRHLIEHPDDSTARRVFSDWLEERDAPTHATYQRERADVIDRRRAADLRAAFRFFLEHAGYATPPGRAACALRLARAELWRKAEEDAGRLRVLWVLDPDTRPEDFDDEPPETEYFGCVVEKWDPTPNRGWTHLASCWGIGFLHSDPESDPYGRVMAAELASEAKGG